MASISPTNTRVSTLMQSETLLRSLQLTQSKLFDVQNQISTGKSINTPSQDASKVSAINFLRQSLASREQWDENLQQALGTLNNVDQALGDATDILIEAQSIAASQIGVGSDTDTRATQAEVIDAQLEGLLSIANRQFNDLSLFGGNNGTADGGPVFVEFLGGIRYIGGDQSLQADVGSLDAQTFNSNGLAAFGALSARVQSDVDLLPAATADTRLRNIDGAQFQGVTPGSALVTVNGTAVPVDLSTADTLGDVATRINAAIDGISPGAGSLTVAGDGFSLTAAGGNTVTIAEIGTGRTVADLGIALSATGSSVAGPSVNRRLDPTTQLADLGAGVDFASGLTITQGETTKTADFSGATTIQDLQNIVSDLGLGVRLEINDEGSGLDLISEVSGIVMSVGENGGTTAQDLGITTLGLTTQLGDFRDGLGIEPVAGEDDITLNLIDGTSFGVNLDGATTVDDVINAINTAATGAGLTPGVDLVVALNSTGNGLVFTDNTTGAETFSIEDVGLSLVASQLGINGDAGAGNTITSSNRAGVKVDSVFTHLIDLRNSLRDDSTSGITLAGSRVQDGVDRVVQARAKVGVDGARIEQQQERSADLEIAEKTMLSELRDADLTEVISRYALLQTQLQASLQVGAQNLQLNLLNFLR